MTERLQAATDTALAMVTAALSDAAVPAEVLASYMPKDDPAAGANFAFDVSLVLMAWTTALLQHADVDPLAFIQVLAQENRSS